MAISFNTYALNSNVYNAYGNQYIWHQHCDSPSWREVLAHVPDARFDPLKGCLCGTRQEIIDMAINWASSSSTSLVLWIHGQAGTGKSTIAHSVADALNERRCLAGSFFFSRAIQARNSPDLLFSTIAYQMCSNSVLAEGVQVALGRYPDLARLGCSLLEQYRELIRNPVDRPVDGLVKPMVIVLDGLDECGTERDRLNLLKVISQSGQSTRVKFFITSRPEPDISAAFSSTLSQILNLSTSQNNLVNSDRDIAIFVAERMAMTAGWHCLTVSDGDQWPGQLLRESLVQKARGLFIWASTACEFIQDEDTRSPNARLDLVLGHGPDASDNEPWLALDRLYLQVLYTAVAGKDPNGMSALIVEILGAVVVAINPLSSSSLSSILGVETPGDIRRRLRKLQSVLTVPADVQELVQIIHPSFSDFPTNPDRCTDPRFYIEPSVYHEFLVRKCLLLMQIPQNLRRDICKLGNAPIMNSVIEQHHITGGIPADLRYACQFWAEHLQRFHGNRNEPLKLVEEFLFEHLLHWLEVLSLLGVFDRAVTLLGKVLDWIKQNDSGGLTELRALLEDSLRFVREFYDPIAASASQIYISALPFTPRSSTLYRTFAPRYANNAKIVSGARENWPPCLTIPCERDIHSLVFSSDGSRVVCSSVNMLQVYDINVGTAVGLPIICDPEWNTLVAFAPNDRHILSGDVDGSVRLWDTYTSSQVDVFHLGDHTISHIVFISGGAGVRIISFPSLPIVDDDDDDDSVEHQEIDVTIFISSMALAPKNAHFIHASRTQRPLNPAITIPCLVRNEFEGMGYFVKPFLALSSCGSYVAGLSASTLYVWNAETAAEISRGSVMPEDLKTIAFSPCAKWILSTDDSGFKVWDWKTFSIIRQLSWDVEDDIMLAFFPRGDTLYFSSYSGLHAWNFRESGLASNPQLVHEFTWSERPVAITVSPDESHMIVVSEDSRLLQVWDLQSPVILEQQMYQSTGHSISSPDSTDEISTSIQNPQVVAVSSDGTRPALAAEKALDPDDIISTPTSTHYGAVVSPDGSRVAYCGPNQTVAVWNLAADTKITREIENRYPWTTMSFTSDGKRLLGCRWTWDLEHDLYTEFHHTFSASAMALAPSGRSLALGTTEGDVYLCDAETGAVTSALEGHTDCVHLVAFSPGGARLVSVSKDRTIHVWDVEKQPPIRATLARCADFITSAFYSPDGKWIIAEVDAGRLVWDAYTLSPVDPAGFDPLSRRGCQNVSFLRVQDDGWVVDLGDIPVMWLPIEVRGHRRMLWAAQGSSRLRVGDKKVLVDISGIAC